MAKRGPKEKYTSEMCDTIIEVAKAGGHIDQMCVDIGIRSRDTFNRWRKEHPEFEEAFQTSKMYSQAFYEKLALAGASGKIPGFNVTSLAMIMNNKFPDDYRRSANGGGEPQQTTVNIINLTPEEIRYKIAQKQELLRQRGQIIDVTPESNQITVE